MTVTSENYRNTYSGNGSTTVFAYTFRILDESEILATLVASDGTEAAQTITTHYTVSGVGDAGGGNVTMLTAPASGETLVLTRNMSFLQETDYTENDNFPAVSHEDALDRLTMQNQQQQEELDRTFKLSVGVTGVTASVPSPVAGRGLKWNDAGTALENTDNDPDSIASAAASSASAAASSASSASSSATAASNSATAAANSATLAASNTIDISGMTADTIEGGDFIVFEDTSEGGGANNKTTMTEFFNVAAGNPQEYTAPQHYDIDTLSPDTAGAATWDMDASPQAYIELTTDTTITATNVREGADYYLFAQQDGTGSHSLAFAPDSIMATSGAGDIPQPSQGANDETDYTIKARSTTNVRVHLAGYNIG